MDDAAFRATLVDYIHTRACVNAADEDVYMKFLEKQAAAEQDTATQQLASVRRVLALVAEINSEVANLGICGLSKPATSPRRPAARRRPRARTAPIAQRPARHAYKLATL